jgi:hypothetical protein
MLADAVRTSTAVRDSQTMMAAAIRASRRAGREGARAAAATATKLPGLGSDSRVAHAYTTITTGSKAATSRRSRPLGTERPREATGECFLERCLGRHDGDGDSLRDSSKKGRLRSGTGSPSECLGRNGNERR